MRCSYSPQHDRGGGRHVRSLSKKSAKLSAQQWALPKTQKNPRIHKNKISTSPPPPKKKNLIPPPLKRGILWAWRFSCRKNAIFQAPIKLVQPFPAPEVRAKKYMDTGIFLKTLFPQLLTSAGQDGAVGWIFYILQEGVPKRKSQKMLTLLFQSSPPPTTGNWC